jgi:hypothetical protein
MLIVDAIYIFARLMSIERIGERMEKFGEINKARSALQLSGLRN